MNRSYLWNCRSFIEYAHAPYTLQHVLFFVLCGRVVLLRLLPVRVGGSSNLKRLVRFQFSACIIGGVTYYCYCCGGCFVAGVCAGFEGHLPATVRPTLRSRRYPQVAQLLLNLLAASAAFRHRCRPVSCVCLRFINLQRYVWMGSTFVNLHPCSAMSVELLQSGKTAEVSLSFTPHDTYKLW